MKTASLDWTNINPHICILYTKKKFYNEFLFRLSYFVPGARLLTLVKEGCNLDWRVNSWNDQVRTRRMYNAQLANRTQIHEFYSLYCNKNFKYRIEQDIFNIYSNSESCLYDLANLRLHSWKHLINNVSLVKSSDDLNLLNQGFTIVKKIPKYPYRVKLKEGFYSLPDRQGIAHYLKNLNDEVRVSKNILARLTNSTKYFSGGYVYIKDHRLIDMFKLVSPTLIGNVDHMINQ